MKLSWGIIFGVVMLAACGPNRAPAKKMLSLVGLDAPLNGIYESGCTLSVVSGYNTYVIAHYEFTSNAVTRTFKKTEVKYAVNDSSCQSPQTQTDAEGVFDFASAGTRIEFTYSKLGIEPLSASTAINYNLGKICIDSQHKDIWEISKTKNVLGCSDTSEDSAKWFSADKDATGKVIDKTIHLYTCPLEDCQGTTLTKQ